MADSSKISFLLFLFTFLFTRQIYARESQFFNKIPSNNNNNVAAAQNQPNHQDPLNKADQEPTFIPENENGGYGLYGHESGQLPPTSTTTTAAANTNPTATNTNLPGGFLPKYLPKNYNTVAYVTQPEGYTQPKTTSNNYYNAGNGYYRDQSQGYSASSSAADAADNGDRYNHNPTNYNANNPTNYNANRYINGQENQFKLDQKDNYNTNADNSNYYNSNVNSVEKQGMSDTRFMENGRYFYDINLEENNINNRYPFENTRTFGDQYNSKNGGYYGSSNENSDEFNRFSDQGFENQRGEQLQDFQNQRALP